MQHIMILGAGYAGLLSALRLQPQIKQGKARVTLVDASDTFTERIRLHQLASGQTLKQHKIHDFLQGTGVDFLQGYIQSISPTENCIIIDDQPVHYDSLVVALGSRVNREAIVGIREHAYTLDKSSSEKLRDRLQNGGKLLVIGGGLTGIEAVTELAERDDIDVHLVTYDTVGVGLSDNGRKHIHKVLNKLSVTVQEHVGVEAIYADYADTNAGTIAFDACLWAGGFVASPLVAQAGLTTNQQGQMLVRDTLQSVDYDNVYGVGDVASITMQNGETLRMACAVAMPMGTHVADNLAHHLNDEMLQPFGFAYALQCISLGRNDALVQMMQSDDTPKDQIFTGRFGAFIKEAICRYTIFSLKLEKRLPGSYRYPKAMSAMNQTSSAFQLS